MVQPYASAYVLMPSPALASLGTSRYEVGGHAMGRGRAKAKQTKVARDLKYNSQDIDLEKLSKELHGEVKKDDNSDDFDPYAEGNFIPRR